MQRFFVVRTTENVFTFEGKFTNKETTKNVTIVCCLIYYPEN